MVSAARSVCVIFGGGGHAKVVIDAIQAAGTIEICAVLDANPDQHGQSLLGVPILGGDDLISTLSSRGATCFAVGLGSVGDSRPRERLFALGRSAGLAPLTVVHPRAICSPWADIGQGCQLLPGSIVNAGARLGVNVIVNSGAIVEHDCIVGDHVHIATGARLSSTVRVGAGAHIGIGASIRQVITIGDRAVVGGGAVVVHDVESNTVVAGVPARTLGRTKIAVAPMGRRT